MINGPSMQVKQMLNVLLNESGMHLANETVDLIIDKVCVI
jgi:hypothetical protein